MKKLVGCAQRTTTATVAENDTTVDSRFLVCRTHPTFSSTFSFVIARSVWGAKCFFVTYSSHLRRTSDAAISLHLLKAKRFSKVLQNPLHSERSVRRLLRGWSNDGLNKHAVYPQQRLAMTNKGMKKSVGCAPRTKKVKIVDKRVLLSHPLWCVERTLRKWCNP
jgi:hypothetical protein